MPAPAAASAFPGLVRSRIELPVPRSDAVSRTALVNRLRASASPLVAVVAPAGYGKTTLLAQWAARDPRPFAWVSVDGRDSDPVVLLRHVGAALHAISPLDPQVLDALKTPGASMWTSALPLLAASLGAAEPLVLVLDDIHLLRSPDALQAIEVLGAHVPAGSALAVTARAAPHLPLARLRADGRLLEIGVAQLALSAREGRALVRSAGVELSLEEVTGLVRECEGWPVALYLTAAALREQDAPRSTAARDRTVAAYFRSEYLARLRPEAATFLRRTSVLGELCGSLCDAVLGAEGSARELERIERSNPFLVPLDRQRVWYRCHRMFRDVLRRELNEREPHVAAGIHRRAADWYEAHGRPEPALEHACAAGDHRRIARIFTAIALPLYHGGRAAAVDRWLARLDDESLLVRHPTVALQGSWIHALRGRRADAERWLRIGELALSRAGHARPPAAQRAWIGLIRAALCNDGVYQMIADAETALTGISREHPARSSALTVLGAGYLLLGQDERADSILAEAAAEARRQGDTDTRVIAIGERSVLAAARNDAGAAEHLARDAQAIAEEGGLEGYGTTAIALATAARAALRHGRWAEARASLDKLAGLQPSGGASFPWLAVEIRIEWARACLALRETDGALSLLAEIRELLREHPYLGVLVDQVEALAREVEAIPEIGEGHAGLTPAELRLLPYLTTHLSFREIGEQLYVSRNTIKTQAISVYRKLGVTSRSDAVDLAVRLGLVDPEATA